MELIDRTPDFNRRRATRCAACGHAEAFDDDWFDRWSQGHETCPGCGVDCTERNATRVTLDPTDPALDDDTLPTLSWWHTSTHPDWPSATYDPLALLDERTRTDMGPQGVARWVQRQQTKALHVGTYEAAIHNMLRRVSDQGDLGRQFYLYRVCLRPDVNITPGCGEELVDFMGDAPLAEACPPGMDLTRYINRHEDPGSISLALGRTAIHSVQALPIPLQPHPHDAHEPTWIQAAIDELSATSTDPITLPEPDNRLTRLRRQINPTPPTTSQRRQAQQAIRDRVLTALPAHLRDRASLLTPLDDTTDPHQWCHHLAATTALITNPDTVIHAIATTTPRPIT